MNVKEVRSHMALVSQEANLFDLSIRDNIKYGDLTRDVSDEEIILAAQRANIHEFILTLTEVFISKKKDFLKIHFVSIGLFNYGWISWFSVIWWRTTTYSYSTSISQTC